MSTKYNYKNSYKRKAEGYLSTEQVGDMMIEARGWNNARGDSQTKECK